MAETPEEFHARVRAATDEDGAVWSDERWVLESNLRAVAAALARVGGRRHALDG